MCFSASASFAVSAVLLPVGVFTLRSAWRDDRRYLAIAAVPLLFGVQQVFEGFLWLAIATGDTAGIEFASLGFLFFAYLFWPLFIPIAANQVETQANRKRIFRWFGFIGLLFGLSLYLPLLLHPDWLAISINRHSILYETVLIYDGIVPRTLVRAVYAIIVSIPLLFSTVTPLRNFGILILGSVILSAIFFVYAFVSIWCFFAALLSIYIIIVLKTGLEPGRRPKHHSPASSAGQAPPGQLNSFKL